MVRPSGMVQPRPNLRGETAPAQGWPRDPSMTKTLSRASADTTSALPGAPLATASSTFLRTGHMSTAGLPDHVNERNSPARCTAARLPVAGDSAPFQLLAPLSRPPLPPPGVQPPLDAPPVLCLRHSVLPAALSPARGMARTFCPRLAPPASRPSPLPLQLPLFSPSSPLKHSKPTQVLVRPRP